MDFRQALPIGAMLAGDYRILNVLGQGGFGLTYKADDLKLSAPVAIKEYFPSDLALREPGRSTVVARSAREEEILAWGRAKFLDEAKTLARFRHPNIVRVARLFEANNTAYMVLDFEMGPSLSQWRAGLGRAPTQGEVDAIADKLLGAVEVVHDAGILHRDIKPANVIMRDGNEPVLIDFGAARQALSAQSRTVHAIVTPGYSPKEQYAVDLDRQGTWSDIYALGATLYFLVTGQAPPDALSRDLAEPMPMAGGVAGNWRPGFLEAIDAAMQLNAAQRPRSVGALRDMLNGEGAAVGVDQARAGGVSPQPGAQIGSDARSRPPDTPSGGIRRVTFDDIPSRPQKNGSGKSSPVAWIAAIAGAVALGGLWYWINAVEPARDEAAWTAARQGDTVAGYRQYLVERPRGRFVDDARGRLAALQSTTPGESVQGGSATAENTPGPAASTASDAVAPTSSGAATGGQDSAQPSSEATNQAGASISGGASPTSGATSTPSAVATQPSNASPQPSPFSPRARLPASLAQTEASSVAASVSPGRWQLATGGFNGDNEPGYSDQVSGFLSELEALAPGKLSFDRQPDGGDNAPRSLARSVSGQSGLLGWTPTVLDRGSDSSFNILAGAVPFGLAPSQHVRWLREEGGRLLEETYAAAGFQIRAVPCGIAAGAGAWLRREIRSPQDFRKLKVRASDLMGRVVEKLGAQVVRQESNRDVVALFKSNGVDASFWYSPATNLFLRNPRPAGVYEFPGVHSPSVLFALLVGAETWTGMSEGQQRLIDEACRRNLDRAATSAASEQRSSLERIRGQRIIVRPFTGPVTEALRKAAREVLTEEASRNTRFKSVLESYDRFRR